MASRISLDELYAEALGNVRDLDFEEGLPGPLPETCPLTLEDLIGAGTASDLASRFRPPA